MSLGSLGTSLDSDAWKELGFADRRLGVVTWSLMCACSHRDLRQRARSISAVYAPRMWQRGVVTTGTAFGPARPYFTSFISL